MRIGTERPLKYSLLILLIIFWSFHCEIAHSEESYLFKEGRIVHRKIQNTLLDLQERHFVQGRSISKESVHQYEVGIDEQDRVIVFLLPEKGKSKDTIDIEALKAYGCEIIKTGDAVIKAKVPIYMLDQIADHVNGISFIRLPDRPLADVVSEGVNLTGASSYQLSGYNGTNAKVAIIDLGFADLSAAIVAGVLPSSVIKIDCTGNDCAPTDFPSEEEVHGTAVAEIVHEMAPGAQLYLIKVGDNLDLKDAKDYCIANGIRIINHSVGWFDTNFYDGTCYFDNAVCSANHAYKNGILWVNAAGNQAQRHYGATFKDTDGDRLHNVTSVSNYIAIHAEAGYVMVFTLTWDAWPVTDQDYDLLLFDSSHALVAASMNAQTGTQPPAEEIVYPVPTTGTYYLAVRKYSTTGNHRFHIFSFYDDLSPHVASSSLLSPSDATGVMAVAAIDWANWATGPQEDFSSQGPTSDGRIKPEISGPDGVSSFVYQPDLFFGTSAAAPHVAGAAALILSNVPTLTVSQLWDAITSSAIDMGIPGQDTIYGFGRLNLSTIYVYPTSIDFGDVIVGTPSESVITILNIGSQNLVIEAISSPSASYRIVGDNCSGKALALGESCTFTARFFPSAAGTFINHFDISSNDSSRNPVTVSLNGKGIFKITLSSPSDGASFNPCSLNSPPTFSWDSVVSFSSYEIQFSADPTFTSIPVGIKVSGENGAGLMAPSDWKKVLQVPGVNGGNAYWRVVGTLSDGTQVISGTRSISISGPQPVMNPILSPVTRSGLPELAWQNNCNVNFKVWFGSDPSFSKTRVLTFKISDPNVDFSKQLTQIQWLLIRRLVGNNSGSTIYWYVEARDGLNRLATTEVMSFELMD
jgi:subtilisin family serine protease